MIADECQVVNIDSSAKQGLNKYSADTLTSLRVLLHIQASEVGTQYAD